MDRNGCRKVKALNTKTGLYSTLMIVPDALIDDRLATDYEILRNCNSPFLLPYEGVIPNGRDVWV